MATTKVAETTRLAKALVDARTIDDVETIIRLAEKIHGPLGLRPVGDRPNNSGTIRVGSDPALGVVERTVNAMDDVLDLGHAEHPGDIPDSPRQAASMWFGVPKTGLADMTEEERRKLGTLIQVWLDESGEAKRPTLGIQDLGLGQAPEHFPKTLLSLNESNKWGQLWNMGTYGQGGAVTFGFCKASIILSRRHPNFLDGGSDAIGWTIVRRIEDPRAQRYPNYQYLVEQNQDVLSIPADSIPELPHGTRVIHIAYDLQGWTGPFTTGLWQFLHSAMFDPVLPFLVTGKRKKESSYGSRIIIGNAARLEKPDKARGDLEVAHKDSVERDLGKTYGAVSFNYWVLRRPADSASTTDPAAAYVRPDSAVSMTLFGQRQDTQARSWIKDNGKLPFLYKNMVVQINADRLTSVAKNEVFASTRERATKSDLLTTIYDQLAYVLRNDEQLSKLNHDERERLLARSTTAANDKVRQRLAKFIKTKLQDITKIGKGGKGNGKNGTKKYPPGGKADRDIGDSTLPNVPTYLLFKSKIVRLRQGAGGYTWVELNAKNGYLPNHDDDLSFSWDGADPGNYVRLTMRSKLLGGATRWFFEASGDSPLKEYIFRATLVTPNGVLTDTTTIKVVPAPPSDKKEKGQEPETGPKVEWVHKGEWDDHGFNAKVVGSVDEDQEGTIIWVNRDLDLLAQSLSSRDLTKEQVDTRATRYLFPVACALWLQQHSLKNTEPRPSDDYLTGEMRRVSEAVLVAIDPDVDVAKEQSEL